MNIRTRMAPSPTGNLHIGTAYATMWPYLFARHNKGTFFLRIEDTDQERSTKEFEDNIVNGLSHLGFDWDEEIYHQMDRLAIYKQYVDKLLDEQKAYYCFCSKEELDHERASQVALHKPQIYSGKCRNLSAEVVAQNLESKRAFVIRFKMPEERGLIEYEDLIHGKVSIDSKLIGDTVIMRANGIPLYNFAVVVDDIEMKITHVIRGDDHISNTPKQVVLFEALSAPTPLYGHFPMILNQDRIGKLSKRTGSTSLQSFLEDGYLPEVLFNYIVTLGWVPKNGQEILTKDEIIQQFELGEMNKSAAAWNEQKLDWMNGEYIRRMSDEELTTRLQEYLVDHPQKETIGPIVPLIKERIKKLSDFIPLTNFIFEETEYDQSVFQKLKIKDQKEVMEKVVEKLEAMEKPWTSEIFEKTFRDLATELNENAGDLFQLIRVMMSGQLVTPPLFETIEIIGQEKVLQRFKKLISVFPLQNQPV